MPMLLRSWWILALRGVLAVALGVLVLALPGVTLLTLIGLFAVYALLTGIVALAGALRNRSHGADWWWLLVLGLAMGLHWLPAAGFVPWTENAPRAFVSLLLPGDRWASPAELVPPLPEKKAARKRPTKAKGK